MAETREEKKFKAALRAQFRLKQTLERIDFEEDVLRPEVNRLINTIDAGKIPQIEVSES